jgi:hypothetical protein
LPPVIKQKLFLLFLISFFSVDILFSQERKVDHHSQTWLGYIGSLKVDKHWTVNYDVGYRWLNGVDEKYQLVSRAGVTRKLNKYFYATIGYTYFLHYPNSHYTKTSRHEHRPFEQLVIQVPTRKILIQNRFRAEQRYFLNENDREWHFNHRLRYQLSGQYIFKGDKLGKGIPYLNVSDEIMFNLGDEIKYNHFDQNRINVGLGYGLLDNLSVFLGYQYGWQKRNSPDSFFSTNTVKLNLIHQLSLKNS